MRLLVEDADFEAFERIMAETLEARRTGILAYCLRSNDMPPTPSGSRRMGSKKVIVA
jgi:hypothetical protein